MPAARHQQEDSDRDIGIRVKQRAAAHATCDADADAVVGCSPNAVAYPARFITSAMQVILRGAALIPDTGSFGL